MKIIVASQAGFCFGVKRAVDQTLAVAEKPMVKQPVRTYGPLIHNRDVVERLKEKKVAVIEALSEMTRGTLIIRSHGVPASFYDAVNPDDIDLVDTTCVFVKKVHKIVHDYSTNGYQIIICGDQNHPEVIGIAGWSKTPAYIIDKVEDVQALEIAEKPICMVAQTTLDTDLWDALVEAVRPLTHDFSPHRTICSATQIRQDEVRTLAKEVDCILVIGGKNSSNTQKLYQIALNEGVDAVHIESVTQLDLSFMQQYETVGVVAGASTPDWIINEVINKLKSEGEVLFNGRQ